MNLPDSIPSIDCLDRVEELIRHSQQAMLILRHSLQDSEYYTATIAAKAAQGAVEHLGEAIAVLVKGV